MKIRNFFSLGELGQYISTMFKKKKEPNTNLRIMHGINRISVIVFLIAILVLIIRRFILA